MTKLTQLYIKEVMDGNITIDDVPVKLRESVQNELNKVVDGGE